LLIDDAQNLSPRVLEEVRMLSCLETNKEKILHIILLGQPELNHVIESPELEQLLQRVRLRFHISSLTESETEQYIGHRMKVAGGKNKKIFSSDVFSAIHRFTGGVPRLVNSLCDTALTCAYADDLENVNVDTIKIAVEELQWVPYSERKEKNRKVTDKNKVKIEDVQQSHVLSTGMQLTIDKNTKALNSLNERLVKLEKYLPATNNAAKELAIISRALDEISRKLGIENQPMTRKKAKSVGN